MNGLECPQCGAVRIVKNGHAHTGKQRYLCRICGHQFTLKPSWHRVSVETVALVDRLLTERISHRGICRVTGVSRSWFRLHLKQLGRSVPHGFDDPMSPAKKA
ncbi:IS1/IS1595 family N-terminal zinc-binding domain-containing protein [Deinococcus betulae]|uniref:IS1/IS1595 family N-terminal zinc-binding domain-containing protein n=1 Tax=Deinococcus betulae TaxID=2873312 RepID=UPI003F71391D